LRKIRSSFADSKVPHKFWPYAIEQAAIIHNVACNSDGESPYYSLHGKHFDYSKLRAWGCLCFYLVPPQYRTSKLSPTALPARYLGLDKERNGHYVHVPDLDRIIPAYHLVFNESRYFNDQLRSKRHVSFEPEQDTANVPIGRTRRQYSDDDGTHTDAHRNLEQPFFGPHPQSPADDSRHGTTGEWNEGHCENSKCLYPKGHDGPCSHEETHGNRFRPRPRQIYATSRQNRAGARFGRRPPASR